MKTAVRVLVAGLWLSLTGTVFGQSTFQNLDFEAANLAAIPSGQYGSWVSVSNAIPGWAGYYGAYQIDQVLQNNYTLGSVGISIFGPNWYSWGILDGNYSVFLQSGLGPGSVQTSASIAQSGSLSPTTKSVTFLAMKDGPGRAYDQLELYVGGQNLPLALVVDASPAFVVLGADISAYAGQTVDFRIASVPDASGYAWYLIDSITFSDLPIPEPTAVCLWTVGGLFLGWQLRKGRTISAV